MNSFTILFAVFWIACGVFAYALVMGHFRGGFPPVEGSRFESFRERYYAVLLGLTGPVGLYVAYIASDCGEHGLRWR